MKTAYQFKQWLDKFLKQARPGDKLPVDRELCAHWDLSVSTIKRVLTSYCRDGRLMRLQGKGTFVAPADEDEIADAIPISSSRTGQDLIQFLMELVRTGEVRTGEALPQSKYLSIQFGISPKSVKKAFASLDSSGLVTKIGSRYWVGAAGELQHISTKKRCAFLYHSREQLELLVNGPDALCIHKMERELVSHGFVLHYIPSNELFSHAARSKQRSAGFDAFILSGRRGGWITTGAVDKSIELLHKFQSRSHRKQTPTLCFLRGAMARRMPLVTSINQGHLEKVRAREAVRYLLRRGADNVLFFFSENPAQAGGFINVIRFFEEMRESNASFACRVIVRPIRTDGISSFNEWLSALPDYHAQHVARILPHLVVSKSFTKHFDKNQQSRWWIFLNEADAIEALEWCRKNGVRVPGSVYILSLECTSRNMYHGISTCVYDWDQTGYAMAHSLIRDIPIKRSRHGHIMPRASVQERLTT